MSKNIDLGCQNADWARDKKAPFPGHCWILFSCRERALESIGFTEDGCVTEKSKIMPID
ncbi:MAG: hypothetical protein LBO66_09670 [Deltaproteobacteria bacterium]|nr:hypothetical protein [Deltaproteobacteria bacterium]